MNASKACFWLAQGGVSPSKLQKLTDIYTPIEVWEQFDSASKLKDFLGDEHYGRLAKLRRENILDEMIAELKEKGIGIISAYGEDMPERLKQTEVCPPILLYYRGDPKLMQTDCLAVVGTRRASRYGAEAVKALVPDLVKSGLTIVSGLATGIDGYALRAALDSGGRPISILASGLDNPSPSSNIPLYEEVCKHGLVLSEYPPTFEAVKFNYPERNRLISGVSLGTLVVEAPEHSGALITANCALEQGREVFAVPGSITSSVNKGSNALLHDGATLVLTAADVTEQLGFGRVTSDASQAIEVPDDLKPVLRVLDGGEMHFDRLCDALKMKPYELSPKLTMLEIMGLIIKRPNNTYDKV